jgi:hypothetical protein
MTDKKGHSERRGKPAKRQRIPRPPPPTLHFSLDQLAAMGEALRSVIDHATADQLPALWNLQSLIGLEISRHHWTKPELRALRHHMVAESVQQLGWTEGLQDAVERLKHHPNPVSIRRLRQEYTDEEQRKPPEQRRQLTWRRRH